MDSAKEVRASDCELGEKGKQNQSCRCEQYGQRSQTVSVLLYDDSMSSPVVVAKNNLCTGITAGGRSLDGRRHFVQQVVEHAVEPTWMIEAGANPKDVQGQMRHAQIQTTLNVYAQFVPESQRRAIEQTSKMAADRIATAHAARVRLEDAAASGFVN